MSGLDAHAKPPDQLRALYKKYQKISAKDLAEDTTIIDLSKSHSNGVRPVRQIEPSKLADILQLPADWSSHGRSVQAYELKALPGLHIIPGLVENVVQLELLDRLLHRDLADQAHKNNVGLHYHIPYEVCAAADLEQADQQSRPTEEAHGDRENHAHNGRPDRVLSFFTCPPASEVVLQPLDPQVHRKLSISQFLNRKLRWFTLGGQYDWTLKAYPAGRHPDFPTDIAAAVSALFPDLRPESAICNLYTPGDTLSLHRDVAEEVDAGLASISMGCDALFVVGLQPGDRPQQEGASADAPTEAAVIRLRSGDAIYMSGSARYAWHGVPQVIRDTCPSQLASWPHYRPRKEGRYHSAFAHWQGWLANKRINLNVRQMRA